VSAILELIARGGLKWLDKRPFSDESRERRKTNKARRRKRKGKKLTHEQEQLLAKHGQESPVETSKEFISMGKYHKAIGVIVGGLVMIIVIRFPFLAGVIPPGFGDQVAVWLGALLGAYFAPKNTVT
jgi:hypothetical protein